ncbi:TPA: discoidin domain-containing protein, partial [Streptococcus suis]
MNRQDKNYQKLYQYSIRKRNWGVGSVVVGIFLAGILQAPTVLASTGATASGPTIENQADPGGGGTGGSDSAQPTATTPAPAAGTTTPAPTPAPTEQANPAPAPSTNSAETRSAEQAAAPTVRVNVPIDLSYNGATSTDGVFVAGNAYDDDHSTYWTSDPNVDNTSTAPQYFTTKLKELAEVTQIDYTPRQAQDSQITGNITKLKLYSSQDGERWDLITPSEVLNNRGTINRDDKSITFTSNTRTMTKIIRINPVVAQYIRLEAILTEHWDQGQKNKRVTAAEFLPRGTAEKSSLDLIPVSAISATSHDPNDGVNRPAEAANDNQDSTYWVTASDQDNRTTPQYLELTFAEAGYISHVEYLPRTSGGQSTGNIKKGFIEYKLSDSDDEPWKRVNVYGSDNNNIFTLGVGVSRKFIQFNPIIAKKIRLGATETHHHQAENRNKIVAAAEFKANAFKVVEKSSVEHLPIEDSIVLDDSLPRGTEDRVEFEGVAGTVTTKTKHLTLNGQALEERIENIEPVVERVESQPRRIRRANGEPSSENAGGGNAGSENAGGSNTGVENAGGSNAGGSNAGVENAGGSNTGVENAGSANAGAENAGGGNAGSENAGVENSGVENSGGSNTGVENSGSANAGSENAGVENSGVENTGSGNAGGSSSGSENAGGSNTGVENAGSANAGGASTGSANTGVENGVTQPSVTENPARVNNFGNNVLVEVSTDKFVLTGNEGHYQSANNRGLQNLVDGDTGDTTNAGDDYVVAELAWSGRNLPEPVTFTFNEADTLNHMVIYKRINANGTLKKYKVEVFADGAETPLHEETITIENPHANAEEVFALDSYGAVKKVKVTFLEAVNRESRPQNNALTVKEISFFKASDIRGRKIDSSTLAISGDSAAYQNGKQLSNFIDGKYSTLTETKWDDSQSNKQTITLTKSDNTPFELTGLTLYKRSGRNGSITKFAVVTKRNGEVVQNISEVTVPRLASLSNVVLNGSEVDTVEIRVLEVLGTNNQPDNHDLTLREIKLFEADPQEVAQPDNNDATAGQADNTGSTAGQADNTGSTAGQADNTGSTA